LTWASFSAIPAAGLSRPSIQGNYRPARAGDYTDVFPRKRLHAVSNSIRILKSRQTTRSSRTVLRGRGTCDACWLCRSADNLCTAAKAKVQDSDNVYRSQRTRPPRTGTI
jgi:hypothetical protein